MPSTVAARFALEAKAEQALSAIASKVALLDSAVLQHGPAASFTLDSLDLGPHERSACESLLKQGGFLLVAQTANGGAARDVLQLLEDIPASIDSQILGAASTEVTGEAIGEAAGGATSSPAPGRTVTAEERIPIVEEELRIGKREVLRGGARVHSHTAEVPVSEQVELFSEQAEVTRRPVNRRLTDEEVVEGGLLQERVIEVSEMREEAIVSKEAFVREELVVTKKVERRIEQIDETVRRTQVETETISADGRTSSGSFQAGDREPAEAGAGPQDRQ